MVAAGIEPENKNEIGMRLAFQILFVFCAFCFLPAGAQQRANQLLKDGNKLYEQKKYPEATQSYMQALKKDSVSVPGMFNLGNALIQQKKYDGARQALAATSKTATDRKVKAGANYNIGNTYMQEQKWQEAVDAYKEALRNNPQDEAAKYNLSYALAKLKQEQKNGGGGKDNKDKNKDQQKKDQQNKGENKDGQDQQNKDQQNKDGKDKEDKKDQKGDKDQDKQQDQRPQPQPGKLSEKEADQMLNALQQEEKKLHEKKEKGKGIPVKVEKDW
jgi:Ca-activated chloride channel family protein